MSESLLNRQNVKRELSKGGGIQTVSKEAIDWIDSVTREACRNLAKSGRRTPGGRLMAPKFPPALVARQIADPGPHTPEEAQKRMEVMAIIAANPHPEAPADDPVWTSYHDWQTAVKRGETKLPFEEWKKEKGK